MITETQGIVAIGIVVLIAIGLLYLTRAKQVEGFLATTEEDVTVVETVNPVSNFTPLPSPPDPTGPEQLAPPPPITEVVTPPPTPPVEPKFAIVGIRIKNSLDQIKDQLVAKFNELANSSEYYMFWIRYKMGGANYPEYTTDPVTNIYKNYDVKRNIKFSVIDVDTDTIVWDPMGAFERGEPIPPVPSSSVLKSYYIYTNLYNVGISVCKSEEVEIPHTATTPLKYQIPPPTECIGSIPCCKENVIYESEKQYYNKMNTKMYNMIQGISTTLTAEENDIYSKVRANVALKYFTGLIWSFGGISTYEGFLYEPLVGNPITPTMDTTTLGYDGYSSWDVPSPELFSVWGFPYTEPGWTWPGEAAFNRFRWTPEMGGRPPPVEKVRYKGSKW